MCNIQAQTHLTDIERVTDLRIQKHQRRISHNIMIRTQENRVQ